MHTNTTPRYELDRKSILTRIRCIVRNRGHHAPCIAEVDTRKGKRTCQHCGHQWFEKWL